MRRPLVLAVLLAAALPAHAAAAGGGVRLVPVGRFAQPVYATAPVGDARRLFVVERRGRIRLVRDGRVLARPFADLRAHVLIRDPSERVDQRGLFSIAFARDYARSGLLYAMYVADDGHLRVDELRRSADDPDRADPRARRELADLGPAARQHHGGQLQVDSGGLLWISTGDETDGPSAQDPASPNGKLLRIDPRIDGAQPEVVALGLRNPWRFSLDERGGRVLIGDVGDQAAEEVDALPLPPPVPLVAANFGWPLFEGGRRVAPGALGGGSADRPARPLLVRHHRDGWCSLVGGYVARDPAVPALRGRYVYGDVCSGRLRSVRLPAAGGARDDRPLGVDAPYLVSFGLDGRGRLLAVSLAGTVWRFAAAR